MSVQFPYRAVICGEEHIVKGWRGGNLLTDKGEFVCGQLYGDYPIQSCRLLEVALLQSDKNGEWLLNGHNLHSLQSVTPTGVRLLGITSGEVLRVHKGEVHAVAWVQASSAGDITELLDMILNFWKRVSQPVKEEKENANLAKLFQNLTITLHTTAAYSRAFAGWSVPIWLTEFHSAAKKPTKNEATKEQIEIAKAAAELKRTQAELRKAEVAANDTLKEALSKWMRFDPPGMLADTKARIEKAVKLYLTDPEKHSLKKIADEFDVSRKTVSGWFAKFKTETGYPVVTHHRHESVIEHLKADSEQDEEE